VVFGVGNQHADVMFVGEGPGEQEDLKGEPFVGPAGKLLDDMLSIVDLYREENCYIANIVKCRPPQNRDPFSQEQDACFSFLEAQINILKPKMILCMGKISSNKMLNQESPIGTLRGQIFEYNNIPLMVTYHPSALLRNEQLKRPAWDDLKMFKAKLDEIKQK
jgi:DNA polymerase